MLDNNQELLNQPHYTIQEVSALKKLSEDTIRRWARRQPDVLIYQDPKPRKRPYRTYRISASLPKYLFGSIASVSNIHAQGEQKGKRGAA